MNVALMQPYLFPYVGYFQMVWLSDTFVFYDDVTFIKQGWINRNRILLNSTAHHFVVPCRNASSNRRIVEIEIDYTNPAYRKLPKLIQAAYRNAPQFSVVYPLIEDILSDKHPSIGHLAASSVVRCCEHLGFTRNFLRSSETSQASSCLSGQDRVIAIAVQHGATKYINSPGGRSLYDEDTFLKKGIRLEFMAPKIVEYPQFGNAFVPGLSIVDLLMFNDASTARNLVSYSAEDHG